MYDNGNSFAEGYAIGRDNGNNNNNGFGNGWEGLIGLALVASLFDGWGGGFGSGGGNRGGGFVSGDMMGYQMGRLATSDDIASGFSTNGIIANQRETQLSIQSGFAGLQQSLCQGFNGLTNQLIGEFRNIDNAVCNLSFQNQTGFNNLANQLASCCCDLKTTLLENKYANERNTCDIINTINAGNQRLVDIYTNDKINALLTENATLKGRISNDAQSAYIINALSPCPKPAYIVPNPNCCYNPCGFNGVTIQ